MVFQSGDAADIWQSIISYYSDKPHVSYVMYKGVVSIFPYVWLYELANIFQVDGLFFIKVFYSAIFSYVSVLGMPFVWAKIANKQISNFSILIFTLSLFVFWRTTYALNNLMIDLPNLGMLIIATTCAIKIKETKFGNIFYSTLGGLFFGLLLCGAGQYQLSFYLLLIYSTLGLHKIIKKISVLQILSISTLLISLVAILYADNQFSKQTVALADKNQEWYLTKKEWLDLSLSGRNMLWIKYGGGPVIDNNRLRTIGRLTNDGFIEQVSDGVHAYDPSHYARLIYTHPIDFATQWINKLFLGVSLDNGNRNIFHLFYIYTLLYLSMKLIFSKLKKVNDFFNEKTLLISAFILPSLVPLIFHVEMRYFLSLQILIISSVVLNTTISDQFMITKIHIHNLSRQIRTLNVRKLDIELNYHLIHYLIFIIVCFSWYSAIYASVGVSSEILFNAFWLPE